MGATGHVDARSEQSWSSLRQIIVALVAVKVAGIMLIFDPQGLQSFDFPKSLFSHALTWLVGGCLIVAFARHGLAILPRTRLHLFVVAFLSVAAIAALFSEVPYVALYGDHASYLGLTYFVDLAVLYLAVAVAVRYREDALTLAAAVGAAATLTLVYTFVQAAGLDPLRWTDDSRDRPFSTFGHPDHLGYALGILIAATAAAAISPGAAPVVRVASGALAAAALVAAGIVGTRGVVLGLAGAAVGIAAIQLYAGRQRVVRAAVGVAAVAVVVALLLAYSTLGARIRGTVDGAPIIDRVLLYASAADAFMERPLLGFGPDGFAIAYPEYRRPESTRVLGAARPQVSAHSWPLQTAVSFGAVGLATLIVLIAAGTAALVASLRHAAAAAGPLLAAWFAYWAQGLVGVNTIAVDWFPWLALGCAASLTGRRAPLLIARPSRVLQPAVSVAVLMLALSGTSAFAANREASVAHAAWKNGATNIAIDRALAALQFDAGRAHYWNLLGLAYEQAGWFTQAENAYAQAALRAPHRAPYLANLAWVRLRQGSDRAPDAVRAAEDAFAIDPIDPYNSYALAEARRAIGKCDLALDAAERAFKLYRQGRGFSSAIGRAATCAMDKQHALVVLRATASADNPEVHAGLAQLLLEIGERDEARRHAKRALELDPTHLIATAVMRTLALR